MTREQILLTQLSEECAEVSQMVSKSIRFGKDEIYPKQEFTNAERLVQEMNDLIGVFNILVREGIVPALDDTAIHNKAFKVEKYMAYTKELGILKE